MTTIQSISIISFLALLSYDCRVISPVSEVLFARSFPPPVHPWIILSSHHLITLSPTVSSSPPSGAPSRPACAACRLTARHSSPFPGTPDGELGSVITRPLLVSSQSDCQWAILIIIPCPQEDACLLCLSAILLPGIGSVCLHHNFETRHGSTPPPGEGTF